MSLDPGEAHVGAEAARSRGHAHRHEGEAKERLDGGRQPCQPASEAVAANAGHAADRTRTVRRLETVTSHRPAPPRYRWVVLAAGAGATAALAAVQGGLPALGPAIQEEFGLSLVQVTAVFTSFAIGTVTTLLAWGVLADRVGERRVIAVGLGLGALLMAGVAASDGYGALLGGTALAGALGSSAIAASGRAVFELVSP